MFLMEFKKIIIILNITGNFTGPREIVQLLFDRPGMEKVSKMAVLDTNRALLYYI